jgi:hypothetical protein
LSNFIISEHAIQKAGWRRASVALRFTTIPTPADIPFMPHYGRVFEPGHLQFTTTSTYRRSRLFTCQRVATVSAVLTVGFYHAKHATPNLEDHIALVLY